MKHMTHNAVGKSFFGGVSSRKSRWLKPAPSSTGKTIVFNYKTATAKQAKQHVALDPLILASIVDHTKLNEAKKYQGSNRSRNTSIPRGCSRKPCSCGGDYVFSLIYVKSFLNAFKKYFSEDFMSRQILEIGSQDKGNCQINSTVLTVESLI